MEFDIFFSISQTPDSSGFVPSEREMFSNFLNQAEHADMLGFGIMKKMCKNIPLFFIRNIDSCKIFKGK